ncbi:MAG: hypothetical protein U1F43_38030 [Myxococcota bacterium]
MPFHLLARGASATRADLPCLAPGTFDLALRQRRRRWSARASSTPSAPPTTLADRGERRALSATAPTA